MTIEAKTPEEYLAKVPEERRAVMEAMRSALKENLPKGFREEMSYGMIGYVVPHEIYPNGYHCDTSLPLPFINLASQKNFIALYHSGIYADDELLNWFVEEYPKHSSRKLDMGKSCIRFKKPNDIPTALIGSLAGKMSVDQWISLYEKGIKR
ncbi:MAG: DUF1801 domain-containing protein [Bacteroidota bacterium]